MVTATSAKTFASADRNRNTACFSVSCTFLSPLRGKTKMRFPRPMPLPSDSPRAWLFAAVALLVALAIRSALMGLVPIGLAYFTFIPAVMLIAYISGLWPALASVAVATIVGWYFFLSGTPLESIG